MGAARPTALMGWHDGILVSLIPALRQHGIEVPQDLSVAGVDRSWEMESIGVSLTSVENPVGLIARQAAAMAIDRVLNPPLPTEIVRLAPTLFVGETTAPPSP